MIGKILSHYRIIEKLGEGGMGVVYKAHDRHLDRFVAIKTLPPERVADPDRKNRFTQEAKSASALNHPNIVTIHDIDQADGIYFIAMECVEGKTLDQLIPRKGMPLREALKYAVQIADALAVAHAAGIVHRDLKPANVMVTEKGLVKVLDFGLAKLTEPVEGGESGATESLEARTQEGTIVGTVSYMSPEQAEGKKLSACSDIFSLGSVLYEMLTGVRAFRGDSKISTLSAILHEEPKPLREMAEWVPRELERVVALSLKKDPARRFQHMDDLRIVLQAITEELDANLLSQPAAPRASVHRWRIPIWAAALAGLILFAVGAGVAWWGTHSKPVTTTMLRRLTLDSGLTTDPALSPDGKLLAYASDRSGEGNLDIWIQHVIGVEPVRLTKDAGDDHQPSFSPDGSKIAFRSERDGGGIYVIPALGGDARLIVKQGFWPRFSPDGNQIAYSGGASYFRSAYVVPAGGGSPREVARIVGSHWPVWSPDGKYLLLRGNDLKGSQAERQDWWVIPVEPGATSEGKPIRTGALALLGSRQLRDSAPFDWIGDRVIFSASYGDSTNIWEADISLRSFEIVGAPRRLTFGTELESHPSFNAAGRLVFSTGSSNIDIWSMPVEANLGRVRGALQAVTRDAALDELPGLSDDGRKMAFISTRLGNKDVWLRDLDSGKEIALTSTPWEESFPIISRDGSRVIYRVAENQKQAIYSISSTGGIPQKICQDCGFPTDLSRDGTTILLQFTYNAPQATLGLIDLISGKKNEFLKHPKYNLYRGHFSPDEQWLACHADLPGIETRVVIAPFHGAAPVSEGDWITVTDGQASDDAPRWSPNGKLLYYFSDRDGFRCIWAQPLEPTTKKPLGSAFAVQHLHSRQHSVAAVNPSSLDLFIAGDRAVFNMGELRGNIWMMETMR